MLKRLVLIVIGTVALAGAGIYAAFQLSPWPSVLLIRHAFDKGGAEAAASIAPFVPKGISAQHGLRYAESNRDALFDVYAPEDAHAPLPVIVWVHGGGFIGGSRAGLSGYLQVLAKRGYVTVGIDYTLAPEEQFPSPLRQTNVALAHIVANAERLNIDPRRIFLAGDSAGAQIAAQTALIVSDPGYAQRIGIAPGLQRDSLRGVVLFCGPYDPAIMKWEGPFAGFMRTVIWSYLGTRDPHDPRVAQMAVAPHVTAGYPPVFISVGNADPLAPQSFALHKALRANGVEVDTLFFPENHQPPLDHEYQFFLSTNAGRLALDRSAAFIAAHSK